MKPLLSLILAIALTSTGFSQSVPCPNCGRTSSVSVPKPKQVASLFDSSSVSRAFRLANAKRAAAGKGPLSYHPGMTRGAEIKVERAARLNIKGHQGGSFYGGNKEGVGWSTQETPAACYLMTAPAGTPAGIAMAKGDRYWHTVLLIHYDGWLPSGRTRSVIAPRVGRPRVFRGRFRIFRR